MPLNIKNAEVEALVAEVAHLTGETKIEAGRRALLERKDRLCFRLPTSDRRDRVRRFLEREVWPNVLGARPTAEEEAEILGYGPAGV